MYNRLQTLLSSEYRSISEQVLIESPFAQLSSRKKGIRAVLIALTEANLIIATDKFLERGAVDAEIETLELVHVIPLKLVHVTLFRYGLHDRFYLKLALKKYPERYWRVFEFGGHVMKHFYWAVWGDLLQKLKKNGRLSEKSSLNDFRVPRILSSSTLDETESDLEQSQQKSSHHSSLNRIPAPPPTSSKSMCSTRNCKVKTLRKETLV